MSLINEYFRVIKNQKGVILFTLPINTALDDIIMDLWIVITKYRYPYKYALCNRLDPVHGFRPIKIEEFNMIKDDLMEYHKKNNGLPTLQKIDNVTNAFYTQKMYLIIDTYYSLSNGKYILCDFTENSKNIYFSKTEDGKQLGELDKLDEIDKYHRINCASANIHLVLMVPDS